MTEVGRAADAELFAGPGEVRALARTLDWGATLLGWPDTWSPALRIATRAMLDAPVPICLWSGSAYALVYNDAYRRILAAKHPAALGQPGAVVWAEIWEPLEPQFAQVRAGGPPVFAENARFEMARLEHGGTEDAWFSYSLSALRDEDGTVAAVLNISPETTPQVRAERALEVERTRLTAVFQQSPSFVAVLRGPENVFESVNAAYQQIVGQGRELVGKPLFEALPETRGQRFDEYLAEVRRTGEALVFRELPVQLARMPGAPLEERFVDITYLPLVETDGMGAAARATVIAHGTDVTAQVRARRDVERLLVESEASRRTAEEAGRLKSEFLATMSHEFRTPLNAILGYAQLLDMGVLGATTQAQHTHLARLQTSARHLLQLVDDVLDVAKVDADRMEVRRDRLATGAAVAAALALVQPQATAKGIRIEDRGVPGPGVPYVGDEHRVRQILVNLLANAVKFTPPGGVVTVACGIADEPDPGVQPGGVGTGGRTGPRAGLPWTFVRVADTGPGIAPALRGRLFEPFTQGDGALTRAHGGTGLGLAISRRLARLMGGDLVTDSRSAVGASPGDPAPTGATFTLWLPTPDDADALRSAAARQVADEVGERGRRTPTGLAAVSAAPEATAPAFDAAAYAVLHALGTRLSADAETVAERYVAALRADGRFPGARDLPLAQLRDHVTPMIGLVASQLITVGEMRGRAPELLADGAQIQRVMAELHGAQRHRLGWAEVDVDRETPLLMAEVERALAGALRAGSDVDAGPGGAPETDPAAVAAARSYAADVAAHIIDQMRQTALRAYRFARSAATP